MRHVPSAERALLCVTGTEATGHVVRLARAVTGRRKLVKFQGCFHGGTDALMMNVISAPERLGTRDVVSAGILPEVAAETLVAEFNDLASVDRLFREHRGDVAAVILEPIPHNVGALLPEPGFLEGLRERTRRGGALLVFDEVITGFRHGLGGFQERCGVMPDLTTLGKAMANGYPAAAICGRADLMERFAPAGGDVFFAGTYNGHPVSTAAALATIEALEPGAVYAHTFRLADALRAGLREIAERVGLAAHVTGYGSIFVCYFMDRAPRGFSDLRDNDASLYVGFHRGMIERGFFMLPINLKRNHVSAAHSDEDVARTLQAAEDTMKTLAEKKRQ